MTTQQEQIKSESFRFEIFRGKITTDGSFVKTRIVGHAYLRSGKHAYKAKLFGALAERFVIVPINELTDKYRILTKEEVQTKDKGKRTYWNVVGDGEVLGQQGLLKLDFDLFGKPLYMSLYPSNAGNVLPFRVSEDLNEAA
jgi:hypothetical protein